MSAFSIAYAGIKGVFEMTNSRVPGTRPHSHEGLETEVGQPYLRPYATSNVGSRGIADVPPCRVKWISLPFLMSDYVSLSLDGIKSVASKSAMLFVVRISIVHKVYSSFLCPHC
jgi:hypothetical protein